eukprot:2504265-Amphidinium_carterae.1
MSWCKPGLEVHHESLWDALNLFYEASKREASVLTGMLTLHHCEYSSTVNFCCTAPDCAHSLSEEVFHEVGLTPALRPP